MRRVFVGDIQGCREELERLLERLRFDPARDRLEPVGDLVNRGPDSLGVLRLLRTLDAGGVLGNHDVRLLELACRRGWGSDGPLAEVLTSPDREALVGWLARRPLVRAWPDVVLVHAGLSPAWADPVATLAGLDPLGRRPEAEFALKVRYCDARGDRPRRDEPPPGPPFRPWFEHAGAWAGRTVVFGHWAALGLVARPGLRGLDTACVWGGALTAWVAEEDRLESVPAVRAHARPRRA